MAEQARRQRISRMVNQGAFLACRCSACCVSWLRDAGGASGCSNASTKAISCSTLSTIRRCSARGMGLLSTVVFFDRFVGEHETDDFCDLGAARPAQAVATREIIVLAEISDQLVTVRRRGWRSRACRSLRRWPEAFRVPRCAWRIVQPKKQPWGSSLITRRAAVSVGALGQGW